MCRRPPPQTSMPSCHRSCKHPPKHLQNARRVLAECSGALACLHVLLATPKWQARHVGKTGVQKPSSVSLGRNAEGCSPLTPVSGQVWPSATSTIVVLVVEVIPSCKQHGWRAMALLLIGPPYLLLRNLWAPKSYKAKPDTGTSDHPCDQKTGSILSTQLFCSVNSGLNCQDLGWIGLHTLLRFQSHPERQRVSMPQLHSEADAAC